MKSGNAATLLFLIKNKEILLAMKKRGFGKGLFNGVGGKIESGETIEKALIRECQEEIGVIPLDFKLVSVINFVYPEQHFPVYVFLTSTWQGEPKESEEMKPKWFYQNNLPLNTMWEDDKFWLERVLKGEKLASCFVFDKQRLVSKTITPVENFKCL